MWSSTRFYLGTIIVFNILYINDLPNASKFETRLFADDTALFLSNDYLKTLNKDVNYELLNIEAWLNANKLSLNYSKTKYLLIKPKTKTSQLCKFAVTIKGTELEKCQSGKYLGIILDENLNWEPHIQFLGKKLSQAVGIIAKMRCCLNQKNLINLYNVFFYSQILYGILGWGCASQTRKRPIQTLQNKVLRIINKTSWKDKIMNNTLYHKYKFLKIDDIYNYEVGKFMYLNDIKALPQIFENYFLSLNLAHNYNTRSKSNKNYFLNFVRTNSGKNSLRFKGVQLWNNIPSNLKSFSFFRFKKEYKKLLCEQYK